MNPDPIKVGFIFLGAACTSGGFACTLLYWAWRGLRRGSYPLSQHKDLTGIPARCVSLLIALLGVAVMGGAVVTLLFGIRRVQELW